MPEPTKISGFRETRDTTPSSFSTITGVRAPPSSQPRKSPSGMPHRERASAWKRTIRRSCPGVVPMVFNRP